MDLFGAVARVAHLRFDDERERAFEAATAASRLRDFTWIAMLAIAIYDAFPIVERFAWPDVIAFSVAVRLGVVTPLGLALVVFARWRRTTAQREWSGAMLAIAAGCSVDLFAALSRAPLAIEGTFGLALILIFVAVVMRLRFVPALFASSVMFAGLLAVVLTNPGFSTSARILALGYVGLAGTFAMFANWRLERHERAAYLFEVRERELRDRLEEQNLRLRDLSETDPLTGIANRRAMTTRLDALMADPARTSLAVFMIDIDHFKAFNDRYGHAAGDACIRSVATALALALRGRRDTLARYGGEEFLAAVVDATPDAVSQIAERMRAAIEDLAIASAGAQPFGRVTVSIGVARGDGRSGGIAALIARADAELYRAKDAGRNCIGLDFMAALLR